MTLLRAVALSLAVSIVGCARSVPEVDLAALEPRVSLLPESHDPAEVRQAVILGLRNKGWATEDEAGTQVIGRLTHKNSSIRVAIDYEPQKITLRAVEATGSEKLVNKYLANLEEAIRGGLRRTVVVASTQPGTVTAPPTVAPAPTLVVFEREQPSDRIVPSIQRALAQHSWVLESSDSAGLVARLNHRKGMVRVRITADSRQASLSYLDSQELTFDASGRSDEYEKWMRNLAEAIRANTR